MGCPLRWGTPRSTRPERRREGSRQSCGGGILKFSGKKEVAGGKVSAQGGRGREAEPRQPAGWSCPRLWVPTVGKEAGSLPSFKRRAPPLGLVWNTHTTVKEASLISAGIQELKLHCRFTWGHRSRVSLKGSRGHSRWRQEFGPGKAWAQGCRQEWGLVQFKTKTHWVAAQVKGCLEAPGQRWAAVM